MRHQAAEDLQVRCEEAAGLRQQISELRARVLEPLQAEHAAMLAALAAVTQLSADSAAAPAAQPADRAHLMAPAVRHAGKDTSPRCQPVQAPWADLPRGSPREELGASLNGHQVAQDAVKAVQQCLERAQAERATLSDEMRVAEVCSLLLAMPPASCHMVCRCTKKAPP